MKIGDRVIVREVPGITQFAVVGLLHYRIEGGWNVVEVDPPPWRADPEGFGWHVPDKDIDLVIE